MIFGPKEDGTYVVEIWTAEGEALAISSEASVIRQFQEGCPTGCSCLRRRQNSEARQVLKLGTQLGTLVAIPDYPGRR